MEEISKTEVLEGTTPTEQQSAETVETLVDDAPQSLTPEQIESAKQEEQTFDENDKPNSEQISPILSVRFNHETKELTEDEAVNYAQKGFKFDSIKPLLDDLAYLAAIHGKTETALIKDLISSHESSYKESLIDRYGDDSEVIEIMMQKYKADNNSKLNAVITSQKVAEDANEASFNSKVASDFEKFKKDFPEFHELKDLPKEVLKSVFSGKDLLTAYLHYKYIEDKKVAKATETQKQNGENSTGSMKSAPEVKNSVWDAAFSGLNS